MTTVTGRFREARLYLIYATSPFRPGVAVPTFDEPTEFKWKLDKELTSDDLNIIVEEGRRHLDRQLTTLEQIRSRAGTLVTLCIAEIAVLSAGASRLFANVLFIAIWSLSAIAALLSLAGAAALLTAKADFGTINTMGIAASSQNLRRVAALSYAKSVGLGDQTIATRITVLRGGVFLAIISALLYAIVWPAATFGVGSNANPNPATTPTPSSPAGLNGVNSCPTCTTHLPSPPPTLQPTSKTTAPNPLPASPYP